MELDGLVKKIILGNKTAKQMVESLIDTPTLINIDIRQGALYAVPLQVETNQQSASAEVSESLIISTDAKKYVTDNVAPGSKSWRLTGYINGKPELEPTNKYMPFVRFNTDILWQWFDKGAVLIYKDGYAQIHDNVVIKELQTSQIKESSGITPFSLTLKELNTMEMDLTSIAENVTTAINKVKNSMAKIGSKFGKAKSLGVTATVANATATPADLVSGWAKIGTW